MNLLTENDCFDTLKSYFKTKPYSANQLDSFNNFLLFGLPQIIEGEEISIEMKSNKVYKVVFGNVYINNPVTIVNQNVYHIYPNQARLRDLNYVGTVVCDMTETWYNVKNKICENCSKKPYFGLIKNTATHCYEHKMEDMIETISRKCKECNKTPTFGVTKGISTHCVDHKTNDMFEAGDAGVLEKIDSKFHPRVPLAKIPIMLGSVKCNLYGLSEQDKIEKGECEKDKGGYFIIKGNERVLMGQIRGNYNRHNISFKEDKSKKYYLAEIRTMSESTNHTALVQLHLNVCDKKLTLSSFQFTNVPVGVILKAYGLSKDDIIRLIGCHSRQARDYIEIILSESEGVTDRESAIHLIGKYLSSKLKVKPIKDKKYSYVQNILENDLLPYLGILSAPFKNAYFLTRLIKKLILSVIGVRKGWMDERDNLSNKRIETSGILCFELFTSLFKKYIIKIVAQLEKKKDNISIVNNVISNISSITTNLQHCFATGNWGVKKNAYIRTGVSQILSRLTYAAFISHLRRVVSPVGKEASIKIRQINGSQLGFFCPCETPEGETTGTVLNLALTCEITNHVSSILIKEVMTKFMRYIEIENKLDIELLTPIFINEDMFGFTEEPMTFVKKFKELRRSKQIHWMVSIIYDHIDGEIRICSDKGRCMRPLFVNTKTKPMSTDWTYLVDNHFIEYLDCNEVEWSYISMYPSELTDEHDYCEIHPVTQLGNIAACIPFPDHSQAPRNVYQSSMGKQSLGLFSMAFQNRTDTMSYLMWYAQRPLVTTRVYDDMGFIEMPSGQQCIVAIAPLDGFNQEDSIVINKNAIERGLFVVTSYRTITEIEKKKCVYITETFCIPPLTNQKKSGEIGAFKRIANNYSLLDESGIIKNGSKVKKGDVIIGKINTKHGKNGEEQKTDVSVMVKTGEDGIIDNIYINTTVDGQKIIKIIIRQLKIPEPGDKFAARSAQKGTCCIVYSQEDMPFTAQGIIPDIVINPHCITSRMTINQLLECVLGKYCALAGEYGNCTPFSLDNKNITKTISTNLLKYGFQGYGNEVLRNGMTGEVYECDIFIGPTFYQRLKHIVKNKVHARAQGAVTTNTRQPVPSRSQDGGFRVGEMERDCIIAHGASEFLKDRLFYNSDPFTVILCRKCGCILSSTKCCFCGKDDTVKVHLPYACKSLLQQLQSMCIKVVIESSV